MLKYDVNKDFDIILRFSDAVTPSVFRINLRVSKAQKPKKLRIFRLSVKLVIPMTYEKRVCSSDCIVPRIIELLHSMQSL